MIEIELVCGECIHNSENWIHDCGQIGIRVVGEGPNTLEVSLTGSITP